MPIDCPLSLLDLGEEVDRVGLERGHVGIGVEGMHAARRMPGGACGQDVPLDQRHVLPAEFGKVIEHGGADDAATDDDGAIVGLHVGLSLAQQYRERA